MRSRDASIENSARTLEASEPAELVDAFLSAWAGRARRLRRLNGRRQAGALIHTTEGIADADLAPRNHGGEQVRLALTRPPENRSSPVRRCSCRDAGRPQ